MDWLSDPRLPAGTLVAWLLLAALWASAADIGSITALLAAGCVIVLTRLIDNRYLRPAVPASTGICAAAIFANEAWGVGMLVLIVLPVVASALTTIADHRLTKPSAFRR